MQGVLASMENLSSFSNQGCRCGHTEHLLVSYFGSGREHVLGSAPQDDYLTDN